MAAAEPDPAEMPLTASPPAADAVAGGWVLLPDKSSAARDTGLFVGVTLERGVEDWEPAPAVGDGRAAAATETAAASAAERE